MSLRTGAIEAAAMAMAMNGVQTEKRVGALTEAATATLDALLDYLEAHADEWEVKLQLPADAPDHFKVSWLIAVLRENS